MANRLRRIEQDRVQVRSRAITPDQIPTDNHGIQTAPHDIAQACERPNTTRQVCYDHFKSLRSTSPRDGFFVPIQTDLYDETPMDEMCYENMTIPTISDTQITHTNSDGTKTTLHKQTLTLYPERCHSTSHNLVSSILSNRSTKQRGTHKSMPREIGNPKQTIHHDTIKGLTLKIVQRLGLNHSQTDLISYLNKKLSNSAFFFQEQHKKHQQVCNCQPCVLAQEMRICDYAIVSYHLMLEKDEIEDDMRTLRQNVESHRELANKLIKEKGLTHCWSHFKTLLMYSQYTSNAKVPTCRELNRNTASNSNQLWNVRDCDDDSNSESSYKSMRSFSNLSDTRSDTCSFYSLDSNLSSLSNSTRRSPKSPSPLKRSFSQVVLDSVPDAHHYSQGSSSKDNAMQFDSLEIDFMRVVVKLVERYRCSNGKNGISQQFSDSLRCNFKALKPVVQEHASNKLAMEQYILEQFRIQSSKR